MNKSYCVFVDDMYYYDFISLYNSWKYYNHKYPIKVYAHNNLSLDKINNIKKHCEVIITNKPENINQQNYFAKQLFKYINMLHHMDEYQILLDADTIFLSNVDHLFDFIEDGYFVGASEFDQLFIHSAYYNNMDDFKFDKNLLQKYLDNSIVNKFTAEFTNKVFNGGFLGFNKNIHTILLEKTIEILSDVDIRYVNPIFHNEQYMINFLANIYNVKLKELPRDEWMNTWWHHKLPKKVIKIENEKFCVYNENGSKINFYHFTGGIGIVDSYDNIEKSCRPHQLYQSMPHEPQFKRNDVEYLWYQKHENPVLLLYEYFNAKGI